MLRIREETGEGLVAVKRRLSREQFVEAVELALDFYDLKDALLFAIKEGLI